MRRALRGKQAAALVPLMALVAGCGGGGAASFPAGEHPAAGGGGALSYALAPVPQEIDPLAADVPATQAVSEQIFEPLIATMRLPYGPGRPRHGLGLRAAHSGDRRVWSVALRPGVSFQDGTSLSGSAVLVNARRWRTTSAGRRLLPGLLAASAPRPDLVRFIFSNPVSDLPALLADPRLGLVSPDALDPPSGEGAKLTRTSAAGSGPFALSGRSARAVTLDRNRRWWGSRAGLGPALDRITFTLAPFEQRRFNLLRSDAVRVAGGLSAADALRLRRDPLLSAVGRRGGEAVGYERSVRGLDSARPQPLNGVWLALVNQP